MYLKNSYYQLELCIVFVYCIAGFVCDISLEAFVMEQWDEVEAVCNNTSHGWEDRELLYCKAQYLFKVGISFKFVILLFVLSISLNSFTPTIVSHIPKYTILYLDHLNSENLFQCRGFSHAWTKT